MWVVWTYERWAAGLQWQISCAAVMEGSIAEREYTTRELFSAQT